MPRKDLQAIKMRFGIIGNDEQLMRDIDVAMQVAPTDLSVLITGESGVGKESFPQIIHQFSRRKHGQYIAVNCGAIPKGTIASELFGHEKGAFTGAIRDRKGYFAEANGGTIFLDEVGELPLEIQVQLLRILESGEYIKVGSSKVEKTDVRIVAATNLNLQEAISEGRFREDLYYRLNTIPIKVPALRDRGDDIILLFRKFAGDSAEKYQMPAIRLTDEAKITLKSYPWPGNVRELFHVLDYARNVADDDVLRPEHLPPYMKRTVGPAESSSREAAGPGEHHDFSRDTLQDIMDEYEHRVLMEALEHFGYNITKTAEALGLRRQSLQYRIRKYGIHI